MYNIGFVSFQEEKEQQYIDVLKGSKMNIHLVTKEAIIDTSERYDGMIIYEEDEKQIGVICELILLLKNKSDTFIWVISKRQNKMNHIVYLQLGVDGIIDNEYDPEVCKLVMTNALSRYERTYANSEKYEKKVINNSELLLRSCNSSIVLKGKEISLTNLEYKTIEFLKKQNGMAVSYEEIYKNVWNNEGENKQYRVSNLIFHLRQKIEEDTAHPKYIKTVRSRGYKLTL